MNDRCLRGYTWNQVDIYTCDQEKVSIAHEICSIWLIDIMKSFAIINAIIVRNMTKFT